MTDPPTTTLMALPILTLMVPTSILMVPLPPDMTDLPLALTDLPWGLTVRRIVWGMGILGECPPLEVWGPPGSGAILGECSLQDILDPDMDRVMDTDQEWVRQALEWVIQDPGVPQAHTLWVLQVWDPPALATWDLPDLAPTDTRHIPDRAPQVQEVHQVLEDHTDLEVPLLTGMDPYLSRLGPEWDPHTDPARGVPHLLRGTQGQACPRPTWGAPLQASEAPRLTWGPHRHSLPQDLVRQKGYTYSATEYGHECFCDNAFNPSKRRQESVSVGGASGCLCTGRNPSFQQCRPWCLTGSLYSTSPSWGYCDLSSQRSTSYNIRCQCPAGFQGVSCDQPCPEGTWGLNCVKVCICNATNTIGCNPQDGTCVCRPGVQGDACDLPCPRGAFGNNCAGRCTCSDTADCDPVTGQCMCRPGWHGEDCKFPCPAASWGPNCSHSCTCNQDSCSPEDGTCSCDPGYQLPTCFEMCEPFKYGPNCLTSCECHGQPCDPFSGLCKCNDGYLGSRCEKGLCNINAVASHSSATDSGLGSGQIAGVVVGVILAAVLTGLIVYGVMRQRNAAVMDRLLHVFGAQSVSHYASTGNDLRFDGDTDNPLYGVPGTTAGSSPTTLSLEMQNVESDS
ncbi:hypothetical protein ACOMHN_065870 [Nucella lapillus]